MPTFRVISTITLDVLASDHQHALGVARNVILERAKTIRDAQWVSKSSIVIDPLCKEIPDLEVRNALNLAIQALRQHQSTETLAMLEALRPAPQRVEEIP